MKAHERLKSLLEEVGARRRKLQVWGGLAGCWASLALLSLVILVIERETGWGTWVALPILCVVACVAGVVVWIRLSRRSVSFRELAHLLETRFPQMDGRLLTAVQQTSKEGNDLNYLQSRVIEEAVAHSSRQDWSTVISDSRIRLAQGAHWLALGGLLMILWSLPKTESYELLARITDFSVTVAPGDTTIERGNSVVIFARFGKTLPPGVELVIKHPSENQRIPLAKSLADPIFGVSIPEVTSNMVYHLEYAGHRTRDFSIKVFDYPRLERADADLNFPTYTGQPPKRIENTRRLSAVEGSRLDLTLQLNKPVRSAQLFSKDNEKTIVSLKVETNLPVAVLKEFSLVTSKSYELRLVDSDGRTNKAQVVFVFDALKNRPPELKVASPRGDLRPSALEEISFEGTVWDDFGVESFGLAYEIPGQEAQFVELGGKIQAKDKSSFKHVLRLEELGVQPDQLVAWFAWADDKGPDGKIRRTAGDLFFAEVRAFDEIFREGMQGESGGGGGGGGGSESGGLLDLQKQITTATWNLQLKYGAPLSRDQKKNPALRDVKEPSKPIEPGVPRQSNLIHPGKISPIRISREQHSALQPAVFGQRSEGQSPADSQAGRRRRTRAPNENLLNQTQGKSRTYEDDARVVHDSMNRVLQETETIAAEQRDPRSEVLWNVVVSEMKKALELLASATNSTKPLPDAVTAGQAVYQALLKVREHEYEVTRGSRNQSQGGGSESERMQRQLEQMEMTQSENRYETQRQAQRPQNNQAREQLQVLNRLQELARRQQDLNERLKELQTALQEARTEQEREEIKRRLKRLQEEEQEMLADLDEVRQRMDRPENQSQMADERRQLEETRQDIQRAAEASRQGSVSQALAAGTRAQRQLQELRDQMRKESSSQFADDMRQMRADARELLRQQEDILKKLAPEAPSSKELKSLTDAPEREQLSKQLGQQKELLTNLVDRATHVSEEAEVAEPLLSRQLYDSLRKFGQNNLKNLKETEQELVTRGLMSESRYERFKESPEADAAKLLDITSELVRLDVRRQAAELAQRSRGSMEDFKQGLERAAQSVLGDDTEALRLAQEQLTKLAEDLEREMKEASTNGLVTQSGPNQKPSPGQGDSAQSAAQTANKNPGTNPVQQGQETESKNARAERAGTSGQQPNEQASASTERSQGNGQKSAGNREGQAQPTNSGQGSNETGQSAENRQATAQNGSESRSQPGSPRSQGSRAVGGGNAGWGNNWGEDWLNNFNRAEHNDWDGGPLTGGDFGPWSDRLREVEEVLDFPDLRNEVATARERARLLRQDFKRDRKKPDWAVVRLQIMKPLLEVRDRVADELARRDSNDALVPIDRDPVPTRYSDMVRRYYEELGNNKVRPSSK